MTDGEDTTEGTKPEGVGNNSNFRPAPPWKPGQSGNPKGGKPGVKWGIRARMRRMLKTRAPDKLLRSLKANDLNLDKGTMADAIAYVAGVTALKGDVAAMKYISDQTEPPLPKSVELTGAGGGAIEVQDSARNRLRELLERREGDGTTQAD